MRRHESSNNALGPEDQCSAKIANMLNKVQQYNQMVYGDPKGEKYKPVKL